MIIQTVMRCHGILLLCTVLLAGCGGTIFNPINLNRGKSVLIDARQRAILNIDIQSNSKPGQVKPNRIVCAEPSPDVAVAVASSLGGSFTIFGKGAFSLSKAEAEGIAQLGERLATIQLLRDGLYRACEAYANGAISNITYAMIVSRIDEVATTMLLGEMAAGAFGRRLAGIGGKADARAAAKLIIDRLKGGRSATKSGKPGSGESGEQSETKPDGSAPTETEAEAVMNILEQVGEIAGRAHNEKIAAEVGKIHKVFMDDLGLDSLIVACVTALSSGPGGLVDVCNKEVFKDLNKNMFELEKLWADSEIEIKKIDAVAEKVKAEAKKSTADAVKECFQKLEKEKAEKVCLEVARSLLE